MSKAFLLPPSLAVAVLLFSSPIQAQGTSNGTQVCAQPNEQNGAQVIPDGGGGAIIAWYDYRRGNYDIYAQRLDAAGVPQWTINGAPVCTAVGNQTYPVLVSDGAGGAIIAWQDRRSGVYHDIYAQHIDASGVTRWTFNGIPVCAIVNEQISPVIASDGVGGAVIAWQDYRNGNWDVFAQRMTAGGIPWWAVDGVAVCNLLSTQENPKITEDGSGGAIVVWEDYRNGSADIYGQRLSALGVPQWSTNGFPFCTAANTQTSLALVSDGAGGGLMTWTDRRSGYWHIYALRMNHLGVPLWTIDGVAVCTHTSGVSSPRIVGDGAGGAIIAWQDSRNGNEDIYAQLVGSGGVPQWTGNGVVVCDVVGPQVGPAISSDNAGGAVVAWSDARFGISDIYAQRIGPTGVQQWPPDAIALCSAAGGQSSAVMAIDGVGGAFVAWVDSRYSLTSYDIFAQRVSSTGVLLLPDSEYPRIVSVKDVPNDQGGRVKLSWTANNQDLPPFSKIRNYWIWRSVPPNVAQLAIAAGARVLKAGALTGPPQGGLLALSVGASVFYWEFVASQPAGHLPNYSYVAPTTSDSLPDSNPYTAFMVEALTENGTEYWYSNPDSGYSVDNLAPATPTGFAGNYANEATTLHWNPSNDTDLGGFRIYRGGPGFEPSPSNLIATTQDTTFVDNTAGGFMYKISAVDIHGNTSGYAATLPSGITSVPGQPVAGRLHLAPPSPNPMRRETLVRYVTPRDGRVQLTVLDVRGRVVARLVDGRAPAGEHSFAWDGQDVSGNHVSAGLYFLSLHFDDQSVSQRLICLQ